MKLFYFLFFFLIFSLESGEVLSSNIVRSPYQKARRLVSADVRSCIIIHFYRDELREMEPTAQKNVKLSNLLNLLRDIRSRITQSSRNRQRILKLAQADHINGEILEIIKPAKEYNLELASVFFKDYPDDELWKFSLMSSVSLPWDELICVFRELYPDGIFCNYSFEDAVFILFLCPEYPGFFYRVTHSEKYQADMMFYTNCLAGAIKRWMEEVTGKEIQVSGWNMKGKSIAENVYYAYWDLFKTNGRLLEEEAVAEKKG